MGKYLDCAVLDMNTKKLILSSNVNNGSKTDLFYFNVNNAVSNANQNNGSQLLLLVCNSLENKSVTIPIPHLLVKNDD